jgi:hypothetical protein
MKKSFISFLVARLLSLSSFFMVIVFYLICTDIPFVSLPPFFGKILTKTTILVAIAMIFACFLIWLVKKTIKTNETTEVIRIRPIESVAMPTYVSLFVVSLEMASNSYELSVSILVLLFVFWVFFERVFYFNPIWVIFGYRFYEIESKNNNTFTLITKKQDLKNSQKMSNLRKINNYTFMELE